MKPRLLLGVSAILLAGCSTSRNYQAGDALVHEERVHFSLLATATVHYRVKLPKVSLAEATPYHFTVRNSPVPPRLTHLFTSLPQGDASGAGKKSDSVLPWENAVVALVFTEPGGTLIYSNRFRLGDLPWQFSKGDLKLDPAVHADRVFGWYAWCDLPKLAAALGTKTNFDAVISVEQPSLRRRDFIQLRGEEAGIPTIGAAEAQLLCQHFAMLRCLVRDRERAFDETGGRHENHGAQPDTLVGRSREPETAPPPGEGRGEFQMLKGAGYAQ